MDTLKQNESLLRILVLDDEADDTELILWQLRSSGIGHVAKCVATRAEFLEEVVNFKPELILSDYQLAGFTGMQALAIARAQYPEMPFIVVTGALGEELAADTIKRGATDYILKHRLEQLVPAILRAIRESEHRIQRRQAEELLRIQHQQLKVQNESLRESEERFRQLAENIHEVFWMTDCEKNQMIYINPGYEEIWGRSGESLYASPRNWIEAIHPEDRPRVLEAALTKQVCGQYNEVYRIVRPDGSIRWIQDRAFPIRNASGRIYRIAGIAEDITERKLAEQRLAAAEAKYRSIFESAPIGIALHGPSGKLIAANAAYQRMLGYSEKQLLRIGIRRLTHPEDVLEGQQLFAELCEGKRESYQRQKRYLHKRGHIVWGQSSASAVRQSGGQLAYIISMVEDITERRMVEREVLESTANERRRIGHELHDGLGQYLAGIAFRAKAFEQTLTAESLPHAREAQELTALLSNAISQTRSLARGLDPIEVETIGLPAALQNLATDTGKFFKVACVFKCSAAALKVEPQTSLALYRIVQEAIHNAITHGEARQIEIDLAMDSDHLGLRIQDDGLGFEVDAANSNGMGLRVMQYRARSIGANLKIDSHPHRGTRIDCSLPRVVSPERDLGKTPTPE